MSFQNNFTALQRVHFKLRPLSNNKSPDCSTVIFGQKRLPVLSRIARVKAMIAACPLVMLYRLHISDGFFLLAVRLSAPVDPSSCKARGHGASQEIDFSLEKGVGDEGGAKRGADIAAGDHKAFADFGEAVARDSVLLGELHYGCLPDLGVEILPADDRWLLRLVVGHRYARSLFLGEKYN